MELDDDNHLCLRCGKTVNGLNNYVLHRQQQCSQFNNSPRSLFLSDSAKTLPAPESHDLNAAYPQDIYRLSANDFFLSLNLQSISCDSQKCLTNINEDFPNRIDLPSLENDLASSLAEAKADMCANIIEEEASIMNSSEIDISNEKWDYNFKMHSSDANGEQNTSQNGTITNLVTNKNLMLELETEYNANNSCDVSETLQTQLLKEGTKQLSPTRKYVNKSNSSLEPKCVLDNQLCNTFCNFESEYFVCSLCRAKYIFPSSFLNHLLICKQKLNNFVAWKSEIFKNSILFTWSLPFKCNLCLFYCNEPLQFLDHLKSSKHCENAGSLKNSFICLPCREECVTSHEIIEHFSKTHLQTENIEHPIIIYEMQKKIHCCFCLFLVKRILHLKSKQNDIVNCDIVYMKKTFPVLILCAVGVAKSLLNSVIKILNKLFDFIYKPINEEQSLMPKSVENAKPECINNSNINIITPPAKSRLPNESSFPNIQFNAQSKLQNNTKTSVSGGKSSKTFKNVVKILMNEAHKVKKNTCLNAENKNTFPKCNSHISKVPSLQKHPKRHRTHKNSYCLSPAVTDRVNENTIQINTYLCEECGYAGKTVHHLTKHKRSHTGEKPFKCIYCSYSCSLSSQLLRHRRLHTGSKPYKCPYCSYTCNTQENLRKHVLKTKKHQGKKLYPCQHCTFDCNIFSEYKEHLLKLHIEHYPNKDKDIISSAVAGIYDVTETNKG